MIGSDDEAVKHSAAFAKLSSQPSSPLENNQ
jgi:hypothetical protein